MAAMRACSVLVVAMGSFFCPASVYADYGEGHVSFSYEISGFTRRVDIPPYTSDAAGNYIADAFYYLISALDHRGGFGMYVTGSGDPYLEYDLTLVNDGDDPIDMFFTATIDIDPITGGLPTTSTLEVEILDPGGDGVDTSMFHRGFLQGVDATYPQTGLNDLSVHIDSAGVHTFQSSSFLPDPQPYDGDYYNRLHVATNFVVPPGDTYIIHGNTTIFVPEPTSATFLFGAIVVGGTLNRRRRKR